MKIKKLLVFGLIFSFLSSGITGCSDHLKETSEPYALIPASVDPVELPNGDVRISYKLVLNSVVMPTDVSHLNWIQRLIKKVPIFGVIFWPVWFVENLFVSVFETAIIQVLNADHIQEILDAEQMDVDISQIKSLKVKHVRLYMNDDRNKDLILSDFLNYMDIRLVGVDNIYSNEQVACINGERREIYHTLVNDNLCGRDDYPECPDPDRLHLIENFGFDEKLEAEHADLQELIRIAENHAHFLEPNEKKRKEYRKGLKKRLKQLADEDKKNSKKKISAPPPAPPKVSSSSKKSKEKEKAECVRWVKRERPGSRIKRKVCVERKVSELPVEISELYGAHDDLPDGAEIPDDHAELDWGTSQLSTEASFNSSISSINSFSFDESTENPEVLIDVNEMEKIYMSGLSRTETGRIDLEVEASKVEKFDLEYTELTLERASRMLEKFRLDHKNRLEPRSRMLTLARNIYPKCDKQEGGIFISVLHPVKADEFEIKDKDRKREDSSFSPLMADTLPAAASALDFRPYLNQSGEPVELKDLLLPVDPETGLVGEPKVRAKVDVRVKKRPQKFSLMNFFFPHKHFLRVSGEIDLVIVVPMAIATDEL